MRWKHFLSFELLINGSQELLCIFIIRLIVGLIEKGRCPNHWNIFFSKLIYHFYVLIVILQFLYELIMSHFFWDWNDLVSMFPNKVSTK